MSTETNSKEVAPGTRDTVLGTLAHLAAVEYAYLVMLEGHPPQSRQEVQAWAAHDVSWFPEQVRELGDRFVRLLGSSTPQTLAAPLHVPWFTFRLTAREGLRQVLTHSAQHRSQVLSWLSTRGIDTPDLDYVLMLQEERTSRERGRGTALGSRLRSTPTPVVIGSGGSAPQARCRAQRRFA